MFKFILTALILYTPFSSNADAYLRPSFSYSFDAFKQGNSDSETNTRYTSFAIGYRAENGLSLGLILSNEDQTITTTTSSSTARRSSSGISFGWISPNDNGFDIIASYYPLSEYISSVTYLGTGYQLDAGYHVKVSKFSLGMHITYRSFSYDRYVSGTDTIELIDSLNQHRALPFLSFWIMF